MLKLFAMRAPACPWLVGPDQRRRAVRVRRDAGRRGSTKASWTAGYGRTTAAGASGGRSGGASPGAPSCMLC